jgi:hypothetical protein
MLQKSSHIHRNLLHIVLYERNIQLPGDYLSQNTPIQEHADALSLQ